MKAADRTTVTERRPETGMRVAGMRVAAMRPDTTRRTAPAGSARPGARAAAAVLAAALLTAGCASTLSSQVTAFHTPDTRFGGRRFAVVASAEQSGSLEYRAYADLVRRALAGKGLIDVGGVAEVPTALPAEAELAVTLRYRIDDGRSVPVATPTYGYLHAGPVWSMAPYVGPGGVVHYAWTPSWPMAYGVVGQSYGQAIVYRRELRVEINDPRLARAAGSGAGTSAAPAARLYEGTAVSEGQSASLAPVMPAMVRALFADFPGPNGRSRVVEVPFDEPPR